ncbi:hypothetical protein EVAR_101983_1 [Eumeta japonica]|uniref:Uncharacterized protein n=1 Tax=Eumeta variegata TaxID=151549 RepID=A0A4C1TT18_EUMVA|nr:hypothetical protein EVAR_101983_1 [Eumeta japonica]
MGGARPRSVLIPQNSDSQTNQSYLQSYFLHSSVLTIAYHSLAIDTKPSVLALWRVLRTPVIATTHI